MSGKGSLILVIGFGVILGYISFNMYSLVSRASEGMIGYSQLASAREGANAGIQIGLSMLTDNRDIFENSGQVTLVSSMKPDSGSFKGSEITVTLGPEVATGTTDIYTRELLSVSKSTLNVVDINSNPVNVSDSVKVTLKVKKTDLGTSTSWETYENKFSQLGWMTVTEGTNIWFATGDTLYGKVHSNGDIRVNGKPVFKDRVTTSGNLVFQNYKPGDSNAVFTKGYETHVPKKDFPNDLSRLWTNRTNSDTNSVLYVDLIPGASSNNNGYAIIRTGSFNGAIIDTISLSDTGNSVIYSRNFIHVRGQLDGRLSICSNSSIYIDNDITYENKTNDLRGTTRTNFFYNPIGTFGQTPMFETRGKGNKTSQVTPPQLFVPQGGYTVDLLKSCFVGQDIAAEIYVAINNPATKAWADDWNKKTAKVEAQQQVEEANPFDLDPM